MRLLKTFKGPNPYAAEPVIIVELLVPRQTLPEAAQHGSLMCKTFDRWFQFPAATAAPGLQTPEDIARLLAAWSLAALNEIRGYLHTACVIQKPDLEAEEEAASATRAERTRQLICLGYHHDQVSYRALHLATNLFNNIATLDRRKIDQELRALWQLCKRFHPDYQAQIIMSGARSKNVPYLPLPGHSKMWQYGWGRYSEVFFESASMHDSYLGNQLSHNKGAAKEVCRNLGVPVARHVMVNTEEELAAAAEELGFPCVVKPSDRGRSVGVTTHINDLPSLVVAFRVAREHSKSAIMVESHIPGDIFRVVVIRGKLAFVIRRESPYIIGDGLHSLQELVDVQNQKISASMRPGSFVGLIPLDDDFYNQLKHQQVGADDVIASGRKITLRKIPLLSSGAMYSDVTDITHPHIKKMAESLAQAFCLQICGIDYMSIDIRNSYQQQGAVIELNATPGLRVPIMAGMEPEAVGRLILGSQPRRLHVTLIVIASESFDQLHGELPLQHDTGWVVGTRSGIGDMPLSTSQTDLHNQTLQVLRNKLVSQLIIVCSPNILGECGMPVDHVDHSIVCITHNNEQPDNLWNGVLEKYSSCYTKANSVADAVAAITAKSPENH